MAARVRLPLLFCPDCRSQLVNHLFCVVGTSVLVCVFCARRRPAGSVVALLAESAGFVGDVPALDPVDAVALLVRLGGTRLRAGAA
jgi:hypothetical protein